MRRHTEKGVRSMTKIKYVPNGTMKPMAPFKTLEEEANYWDTHSVLDEVTEKTVVGVHRANKEDALTIRLARSDIEQLRGEASRKGLGLSTLARMWILERLRGRSGKSL
jgi:predicted DNA binding CopG/RHH family protein